MKQTISILGQEYRIEIHKWNDDTTLHENSWACYCCADSPLIVLADYDDEKHFNFNNEVEKDNYAKSCLRHEIIHAFLNESGLKDSTSSSDIWSRNEEMVDWLAIQFPKIAKVYEQLGIL